MSRQFFNWCYTLNNYSDADVERLSRLPDGCSYHIFGFEVGEENGTPHLQGFVRFLKRTRFTTVKLAIGGAVDSTVHVEESRNPERSIEYCKKEGDYREFGTVPSKPGKDKDKKALTLFMDAVKAGERDPAVLRELHPQVMARYRVFCEQYIRDNLPVEPFEVLPLRPWQVNAKNVLDGVPDDRAIYFLVGEEGNEGKSWFTDYVLETYPNTVVLDPGKKADMACDFASQYRAKDGHLNVIVDAPRSKQGGCLQYAFLEKIKDKRCVITKYDSRTIRLTRPHVFVMMNELPDKAPISEDRYHVYRIPQWERVPYSELPDREEERSVRFAERYTRGY